MFCRSQFTISIYKLTYFLKKSIPPFSMIFSDQRVTNENYLLGENLVSPIVIYQKKSVAPVCIMVINRVHFI